MKEFRKQEIVILAYRLFLVFAFYQVARLLFWWYNKNLVQVEGISDYLNLAYHGTQFDTTAIVYLNGLFIFLSLIPLTINTHKYYQKILFFLYFITNSIGMLMNFGDFIYYKFSQARLTTTAVTVAQHESNLVKVFFISLKQNPSVAIAFIICMGLWVYFYQKIKIQDYQPKKKLLYFGSSILTLAIVTLLAIGGVRGDFKHSTRPVNLVDANRYVKNPVQANLVLNSVFSFFRTMNTNNFKEVHFVDEKYIDENIKPYKTYESNAVESKPNIVIFILESFGKEYSGAFNKNTPIKNFVSYTPFVDSLAQHSLILSNAFANGRQSIHGMSSVLAGIPSLTDAFTSSPFSNQKIQSIVSISNEMGYDTSFFHGAPNGSMGFLGFGNILGFKHYYGKTEYNNDNDFDGIWGIWDEPFFQYFAKTLNQKHQPFMSTLFSVSSHHPFKVPEKYKGKFRKGPLEIHEPIGYTDFALKKFFQTVQKMPWYSNTIFVLVADHTNQIGYPEYEKTMNRFAIPILFYSPNPKYNLHGDITETTQQIDIYPTLAELMAYPKKIRTWGQSVVSKPQTTPIIVNSDSVMENFMIGNYLYRFDGKDVVGIFNKKDLNMDKNLLGKEKNEETERGIKLCKAWYQDYMNRVINRKLH